MSREVIWTRQRFELLCEQGMLSDRDCRILEMHIRRFSALEIAMAENMDISRVNAVIKRLKRTYDVVQKEFPDRLDPRQKSINRD